MGIDWQQMKKGVDDVCMVEAVEADGLWLCV